MKENKQSPSKNKSPLDLPVLIALFACVASFISALSSCQSSREAIKANRANLKPYITFSLAQNPVGYVTPTHVLLPYKLLNTGAGPALEIRRRYISSLLSKDGKETIIQDYPMPISDNLLPSQETPVHNDHINVFGFDPSTVDRIKVSLTATYHGDYEIDKMNYYSRIFWELHPIKYNDKIIFVVGYINFDFGIGNNK